MINRNDLTPEERYAETVKRHIREGRGRGVLANYQPWVTVRSFGPKSGSWRPLGKTGRTHHLLSGGEMNLFALLNRSTAVTDIREQFPLLPLTETQNIASEIGCRHPRANPSRTKGAPNVDVVMTTDFLVDLVDHPDLQAHVAISCKQSADLHSTPRKLANLLNKAEIERRYWKARGIPFLVITERNVPKTLSDNIRFLHRFTELKGLDVPESVDELAEYLFDRFLAAPNQPVKSYCKDFDRAMDLPSGTGISIVWHCLATGAWSTDLTQPLDAANPLHDLDRGT